MNLRQAKNIILIVGVVILVVSSLSCKKESTNPLIDDYTVLWDHVNETNFYLISTSSSSSSFDKLDTLHFTRDTVITEIVLGAYSKGSLMIKLYSNTNVLISLDTLNANYQLADTLEGIIPQRVNFVFDHFSGQFNYRIRVINP